MYKVNTTCYHRVNSNKHTKSPKDSTKPSTPGKFWPIYHSREPSLQSFKLTARETREENQTNLGHAPSWSKSWPSANASNLVKGQIDRENVKRLSWRTDEKPAESYRIPATLLGESDRGAHRSKRAPREATGGADRAEGFAESSGQVDRRKQQGGGGDELAVGFGRGGVSLLFIGALPCGAFTASPSSSCCISYTGLHAMD